MIVQSDLSVESAETEVGDRALGRERSGSTEDPGPIVREDRGRDKLDWYVLGPDHRTMLLSGVFARPSPYRSAAQVRD
jgi:hypothetical protein